MDRDLLNAATDSRSLPDLPNKKDATNWVEKAGGLPSYIERIAKHLHYEKGMSVSHAIATAVNTVKKWAAGGGGVKADTRAKAAKAVAQWEAKKAKSKLDTSIGGDSDLQLAQAMAAEIEMASDPEFDMAAYEWALDQERERLQASITMDEDAETPDEVIEGYGEPVPLATAEPTPLANEALKKLLPEVFLEFENTRVAISQGPNGELYVTGTRPDKAAEWTIWQDGTVEREY